MSGSVFREKNAGIDDIRCLESIKPLDFWFHYGTLCPPGYAEAGEHRSFFNALCNHGDMRLPMSAYASNSAAAASFFAEERPFTAREGAKRERRNSATIIP